MDAKTINQILGVTESYQAPQKMLELALNPERREIMFDEFLKYEKDLSYEWFQSYFENEHADRKVKKQDFTPNSVSELGARILGKSSHYFEATAGTGGMAIQYWNLNPDAHFELEELSDRAIPFLLFNMAIRNVNGIIRHGDSLEGEFEVIYTLIQSERYSLIAKVGDVHGET